MCRGLVVGRLELDEINVPIVVGVNRSAKQTQFLLRECFPELLQQHAHVVLVQLSLLHRIFVEIVLEQRLGTFLLCFLAGKG